MSPCNSVRDWDAETYDRIAQPQFAWADEVLARLVLAGDETVLDAGCGSGRVTLRLVERLPRGRVIGVDGSPSMIAKATAALGDRAEVIECDLAQLELGEQVDAVFSNAVFHWVSDHARLFACLYDVLRSGGRLVAQCGGKGNVSALGKVVREVSTQPAFRRHLGDWDRPWNFQAPDATAERLDRAGFEGIRCWLEPRPAHPDEPREYLRAVTLGPHLGRLPDELQDPFVDAVTEAMGDPLVLDYVRLNIDARRPAA